MKHQELVQYVQQELAAARQQFFCVKRDTGSQPNINVMNELDEKLNDISARITKVDSIINNLANLVSANATKVAVLEDARAHEAAQRDEDRKTNIEIQLTLRELLTTQRFLQGQQDTMKGRAR